MCYQYISCKCIWLLTSCLGIPPTSWLYKCVIFQMLNKDAMKIGNVCNERRKWHLASILTTLCCQKQDILCHTWRCWEQHTVVWMLFSCHCILVVPLVSADKFRLHLSHSRLFEDQIFSQSQSGTMLKWRLEFWLSSVCPYIAAEPSLVHSLLKCVCVRVRVCNPLNSFAQPVVSAR